MQKAYPDWSGFSDTRFIKDEIDYKHRAITKARELLSETEIKRLIDEEMFDEIISRFKIIRDATNLLWTRGALIPGDLAILEDIKLDKQVFCKEIFELIYGPGLSQDRLAKFLNFVVTNDLPNKWTFPTYFLFIFHPDTEMFVRPRTMSWFFKYIGGRN